ncbi:MAG: D-alanine--D-alanine ligase [Nitrospirae bacterium]|nr:D-alanine--D-alanine ligase [Nitrospirota bacterium]MBF0534221.1 D-alanine--D-alanine ligase [Nitrospirota bacterium]MBF0615865.1 D-alanine--D-alanine ligase [Nitrospirota bacterium]
MKEELKNKTIAVLMGGESSEREISIKSAKAVSEALRAAGYNFHEVDAMRDVAVKLRDLSPDVVFIALHGGWGENGGIQGLLDVMGNPYTGSGVLASAIAMDKVMSKRIFIAAGLRVPPCVIFRQEELDELINTMPIALPLVIKPSAEGSSVGVSLVKSIDELKQASNRCFSYGAVSIIEKFITGKEIHMAVLNSRVLGAVEVRPKGEIYDYEAKYVSGDTRYILPPELTQVQYEKLSEASLKAYEALGCSGVARIDTIYELQTDTVFVLEVNTLPGMTETSLVPKIAKTAGYSFLELIEQMLLEALNKHSHMYAGN